MMNFLKDMSRIKPPSPQDLEVLFCPFCFRKIYPKKQNYGTIASSDECHSKEQISNQTEANQRLV